MKSTRSWKPICGCVTYVSHVSLPLNHVHVCSLNDKPTHITSFPPQLEHSALSTIYSQICSYLGTYWSPKSDVYFPL